MNAMKLGKIEGNLFDQFILNNCGSPRDSVLVKPGFGVDVSVVSINAQLSLAMTSDPLSLIPSLGLEASAWLSVHLMANDMATTGFAPQFGQFVLNLPAGFSKADFGIYWNYVHQFCSAIGVSITGGHTGFIEGQNSTIAGGGTLMSIVPQHAVLVSSMAEVGNVLLVTKSAAISSTSILAMSFPNTVKRQLGKAIYEEAAQSFYQTTSLQEALTAAGVKGAVAAMHDVTEGGVLGAIFEMAVAAGKGCMVYNNNIPIGYAQQSICQLFEIDPRYAVGAGAMVIACRSGKVEEVKQCLHAANITCTEVGKITDLESGRKLVTNDGRIEDLAYPAEDPYWAAYFNALKQGWT